MPPGGSANGGSSLWEAAWFSRWSLQYPPLRLLLPRMMINGETDAQVHCPPGTLTTRSAPTILFVSPISLFLCNTFHIRQAFLEGQEDPQGERGALSSRWDQVKTSDHPSQMTAKQLHWFRFSARLSCLHWQLRANVALESVLSVCFHIGF